MGLGTAAALLAALVAFGGAVASVAMWVQRVNTDRARFDRSMSTAVRVFEIVLDRLPEGTYEGKSSPIRLNEAGRDASRFLGAKDWAVGTAHGTAEEVEGMSPYAI